jgi:hypothetical protein
MDNVLVVRISVLGGVAYVDECPDNVTVLIQDWDNEEEDYEEVKPGESMELADLHCIKNFGPNWQDDLENN